MTRGGPWIIELSRYYDSRLDQGTHHSVYEMPIIMLFKVSRRPWNCDMIESSLEER